MTLIHPSEHELGVVFQRFAGPACRDGGGRQCSGGERKGKMQSENRRGALGALAILSLAKGNF